MHKNILVSHYSLFLFIILWSSFTIHTQTMGKQHDTDSLLHIGLQAYNNKDYALALKYMNQQLSVNSNSINQNNVTLFLTLAKSYAAIGQYEKAYGMYAHYMIIKDSLFSVKQKEAISNLENDYLSEQKDKQIIEQKMLLAEQHKLSQKKAIWLFIFIAGGALIAVLCFITYRNYRNKKIIYKKTLDRKKREQEIALLNATIKGAERERKEIMIQLETNIIYNLSRIQKRFLKLGQTNPELKNASDFKSVLQTLEDARKSLQESVLDFSPDQFAKKDLLKSIDSFIKGISHPQYLCIELQTFGSTYLLPPQVELTIFRIAQELIQNIIKHAEATKAKIQLIYDPSHLHLVVSDNGKGFAISKANEGLGLSNVRQRVVSLNGTISIDHEKGTRIQVFIPH